MTVLDAGALIAVERADRRAAVLLDEASALGRLRVPVPVLAQVWRDGARQARISRFLRSKEVDVVGMDAALARTAGVLLGRRGGSDVVDAVVVVLALAYRTAVVTSDVDDLRRLDDHLRLVPV